MVDTLFTSLEHAIFAPLGSYTIMAFFIVLFFIIVLMILGVDFRYSLLINSVLIVAMTEGGWLPRWLSPIAWLIVIGYGGYILYSLITERF